MVKQPLPQGLNLVVQQRLRHFEFNLRNTDTIAGDASLHGLYTTSTVEKDSQGKGPQSVLKRAYPLPFPEPEPGQEERKQFAYNCMQLPEILTNSGYQVLDAQVDSFYTAAERQIANLKRNVGKVLGPQDIRMIEEKVNQYALRCIEVKVQCVRVTRDNPKGSHKRSDGLYSKTTVMRTVHINRWLPDDFTVELINTLVAQQIQGTTTAAQYRIKGSNRDSIFLEAVVTKSQG